MKGNLIITVGISNSGKSTFVAKTVQANPETHMRVNRDSIRSLLYGYTDITVKDYYHRKDFNQMENEVTRIEDNLIYDGLEANKTVIIDATHLKKSHIERYKFWNVPTQLKLFPIDSNEAFRRNELRSRKVETEVIANQVSKFNELIKELKETPIDFTPSLIENDMSKPHAVLLDLDGTICKMNGRDPFEWHRVGEDLADYNVKHLVRNLSKETKLIICTGRDGSCVEESELWLIGEGVEYDEIYIRPTNDLRPDWVVKEEMWRKIVEDYYIVGLIDDRQQVVRRARMLGLKVFNVEYNNF